MKLVSVHFVCTIALCLTNQLVSSTRVLPEDQEIGRHETHEQWMSLHGRVYESQAHREERAAIYYDNLAHIKAFNSQPNTTYKLKVNEFADLTYEEFRNLYTSDIPVPPTTSSLPSETTTLTSTSTSISADSVPASIDWRQYGAIAHTKNQKTCGSCWAFATIAAVEGITKIRTGKLTALSEQELVDCIPPYPSRDNCNGNLPTSAYGFIIEKRGVTTEESYPYQERVQPYCYSNSMSNRTGAIDGYVLVETNDEEALKRAVAKQPVLVQIATGGDRNFQFIGDGIYNGPCGFTINHAVLALGYGEEANGQKYWLLKNSWGPTWGIGGIAKFARGLSYREGVCNICFGPSYPVMY